MFFILRDDDTNYFTKPEELEICYKDIWDNCPVNLSVVPFHGCTKTGAIPRKYWYGNEVFPVGDNKDLIKFLKEKINEEKVYVTLHGYSHVDERNGYEFETGKNLFEKVAKGKKYLEQIFNIEISWFVPPHNSLSRIGWEAAVRNGLNISGIFSPRIRGWHLYDINNVIVQNYWKRVKGIFYPFPVKVDKHLELYAFSLTSVASIAELIRKYEKIKQLNGYYCLATHYWELHSVGNDIPLTLREYIIKLIRQQDLLYCSFNKLK